MNKKTIIGLRAFKKEESDFFYGRKKEVENLLLILQKDKLVTLIGSSGSGKSSLINAGLIPRLEKGFLAQAGNQWAICKFRPGISPIENLSYSLTSDGSLSLEGKANTEDFGQYLKTIKDSDSLGLTEIYKKSQIFNKKNLLIIIDQLEDMFKYKRFFDSSESDQDDLLLNLVSRTIKMKDTAIYFVLVIQSEHFSNLTQYVKLQEIISKSQYAIPNIKKATINEIVKNHMLPKKLIFSNEAIEYIHEKLDDDSSLLPNMQFLFKQLIKNNQLDKNQKQNIIGIPDIKDIGGLKNCIQYVFEDTYRSLSEIDQKSFEKINKALYHFEISSDGKYNTIQKISLISGLSIKDVSRLIIVFKDTLEDSYEVIQKSITGVKNNQIKLLASDDILSNKYQSQRNWKQESIWANQEEEGFKSYFTLAKLTEKFNFGKASLLISPELEMAQEWIQNTDHSLNWSRKYGLNYQNTIDYINRSIETDKLNRTKEEKRLKRKKTLTRQVTSTMGVLMVLLIFFAYISYLGKEEAKESREIAINEQKIAQNARQDAEEKRVEADRQKEEAERQKQVADIERKRAMFNELIANKATESAKLSAKEAKIQADKAQTEKAIANIATEKAIIESKKALDAQLESENRRKIAEIESEFYPLVRKLERLVQFTNGMEEAYKSQVLFAISEALEKFDTYSLLHEDLYGTSEGTEGTYMILQTALRVLEGKKNYNETSMLLQKLAPKTAIRTIASYNNSVLAFGGDNGDLYILNTLNKKELKISIKERIRKIKFINPTTIFVGTFEGNVYKIDLSKSFSRNQDSLLFSSKSPIIDIIFDVKTNDIFIFSEKEVIIKNLFGESPKIKSVSFKIKSVASYKGQLFIGSNKNIFIYDGESIAPVNFEFNNLKKEEISTFILSETFLFIGTKSGKIITYLVPELWENEISFKYLGTLELHRSGITKLYFDELTNNLYSSSFDNQILKYKIDKMNFNKAVRDFTSLIGHEKWVWDISLIKNMEGKEVVVTVDENGNVLTWYKNQTDLALKVKSILVEQNK